MFDSNRSSPLTAEVLVSSPGQPEPASHADLKSCSLDPEDWEVFRRLAHQALDEMISRIASVEERPVWQPLPSMVREKFERSLPVEGRDLSDVLADFWSNIEPFATGNRHPLFMGWVHGAGTPVGMVAEMLSAGLNANCGGRDHVGLEVERQITRWAAEIFDFPSDASGIFVTGTSMANFLGLLVARNQLLGEGVRTDGLVTAGRQLVVYASDQAHACISQAVELAGIGSRNLRSIPTDWTGALVVEELEKAIAKDREEGRLPFLIVGTAGTVNTGAIDPLDHLADIARAYNAWFHVDGAFGALLGLSTRLRPRLKGIERADSIAFDFHKWGHVPYDCGFFLVRDGEAHKSTFSSPAAYLARAKKGLAAGETWPCDLGPDLSRGFRALKVWFTFQTLGANRIAASIERCCDVARYLEEKLRALPIFEIVAPARLNIVCWRVRNACHDDFNEAIVTDLHERGLAVPSMTTIRGRPAIRAAIVNHRTTEQHIDSFIDAMIDVSCTQLDDPVSASRNPDALPKLRT